MGGSSGSQDSISMNAVTVSAIDIPCSVNLWYICSNSLRNVSMHFSQRLKLNKLRNVENYQVPLSRWNKSTNLLKFLVTSSSAFNTCLVCCDAACVARRVKEIRIKNACLLLGMPVTSHQISISPSKLHIRFYYLIIAAI